MMAHREAPENESLTRGSAAPVSPRRSRRPRRPCVPPGVAPFGARRAGAEREVAGQHVAVKVVHGPAGVTAARGLRRGRRSRPLPCACARWPAAGTAAAGGLSPARPDPDGAAPRQPAHPVATVTSNTGPTERSVDGPCRAGRPTFRVSSCTTRIGGSWLRTAFSRLQELEMCTVSAPIAAGEPPRLAGDRSSIRARVSFASDAWSAFHASSYPSGELL